MHKSVNSKTLHSTLSLGFLNFVSVLITCVCIEDGAVFGGSGQYLCGYGMCCGNGLWHTAFDFDFDS